MSEDEEGAKRPVWENHFQSIMLAVICGVMAWVGNGVSQGAVVMARQEEKISNLTQQLSELKISLQTTSKDFSVRDERINAIDARVRDIERQAKR